jgi:hypothetical protein
MSLRRSSNWVGKAGFHAETRRRGESVSAAKPHVKPNHFLQRDGVHRKPASRQGANTSAAPRLRVNPKSFRARAMIRLHAQPSAR